MLVYCSHCVYNLFLRVGNRGRWPASVKLVTLGCVHIDTSASTSPGFGLRLIQTTPARVERSRFKSLRTSTFHSVTRVLMETGMPSFDTLLHNSHVIFSTCWNTCNLHNKILGHLAALIVFDVHNF